VNFVKDGYGVYWDEQGDTYAMLFVEGELMNKEMAGFGSGNVEGDSFMRDYVRAIAGDDGMRFTGRLPGAFGAE
jgi:hypothetical protein